MTLDEKGLEGVELGGENSFRDIIAAFMPEDDIRQRSDLTTRDVQALSLLGFFVDEYGCKRFKTLIMHYMNLRRSVDRKSSGEVKTIFNSMVNRRQFIEDRDADDRKMEAMLDE